MKVDGQLDPLWAKISSSKNWLQVRTRPEHAQCSPATRIAVITWLYVYSSFSAQIINLISFSTSTLTFWHPFFQGIFTSHGMSGRCALATIPCWEMPLRARTWRTLAGGTGGTWNWKCQIVKWLVWLPLEAKGRSCCEIQWSWWLTNWAKPMQPRASSIKQLYSTNVLLHIYIYIYIVYKNIHIYMYKCIYVHV